MPCQGWKAELAELRAARWPETEEGRWKAVISTWAPAQTASWEPSGGQRRLKDVYRGGGKTGDKTLVIGVCQMHPANNFPSPALPARSLFVLVTIPQVPTVGAEQNR